MTPDQGPGARSRGGQDHGRQYRDPARLTEPAPGRPGPACLAGLAGLAGGRRRWCARRARLGQQRRAGRGPDDRHRVAVAGLPHRSRGDRDRFARDCFARVRAGHRKAEGTAGRVDELAAASVTVTGLLGQDLGKDLVHGGRQIGPQGGRRRGALLHVREDDRRVQVLLERNTAGEAFVQHAAQRVLVGLAVHRGAADLLGSDVVDRAEELPSRGQPAAGHDVLGDPEVGEVHVIGILVARSLMSVDAETEGATAALIPRSDAMSDMCGSSGDRVYIPKAVHPVPPRSVAAYAARYALIMKGCVGYNPHNPS